MDTHVPRDRPAAHEGRRRKAGGESEYRTIDVYVDTAAQTLH